MSAQLQVTGEAKVRDIQGPVVANGGVITALDGAASQYVRGDGTLADFPTSTGGGSSVSYYLNGSVNQGNIAGSIYYQMSKTPVIGTGTDFSVSTNNLIAQFITDVNDPSLLEVPGGNFNLEFYCSVSNNTGNPYIYAELYKYNGSNFTLLGSSQAVPEYLTDGTTISPYYFAIPLATAALSVTDRIVIRVFANVDGRTVTLHTENSHLCQVVTTFSKGMISLNNLTKQNQYLAVGTAGSDFNISSSGDTHTFNIPNAGSSNRGLITSGIQTIAGAKTFSDLLTTGYVNINGVLTLYSNLSNGSFNYTLPSANGQLALTSQIPSITGTAYQVTRYNSAGTAIEGGSILDYGTAVGTPPSGFVIINGRLTVNNYTEINRYLSIIQNVDSSWALPSTGTSLEAFITSAAGGLLISDTAYLRPRNASDDTYKRFVIQGNDLILNDAIRRTLINKSGPTQSTTKLEVAGYARFDSNININSTLYFEATDASQPTYLGLSSGNLTMLTSGQIALGTNGTNKFVFDVNGALNLGTSDNSNIININNQFSTLNSTIQGIHITPSIVSASPVIYTGVKSYPQFFLSGVSNYAEIKHFSALNASNTQDNASQIGLYIENFSSIGLAYGIQSLINSGTNRYNLYLSGTANNYLKGRLGVDQTNPLYAVDVTGDVNVTGNFKVNGVNLTQGISGGGTQNYLPRYTSATTLGDSKIYQAPASGHLLVNTTYDYSGDGGYLQVAGGFTTESFANIIYGSSLFAGNTVTFRLANGNTIQGPGDRTYFIENRINSGATSANYYLNYWDGGTASTRYSLDNAGLHSFYGQVSISSLLTGENATFSQKIGIGTTTGISASLTIFNTSESNHIKVAGSAPGIVYTDSLSSPTIASVIGLVTANNNFITGATPGQFVIVNQTNNAILFATGATVTEKMRLASNGRLLLGTTTDNGSLLQVNGTATFSSNSNSTITNSFQNSNTTDTNSRNILNIIAGNVSTSIQSINNDHSYINVTNNLYFQSGGGVKMTMLSNGNVGIGTSSPNSTLQVRGDNGTSASSLVRLRDTNATARTTRLQFEDYAGAYADGIIDFVLPTAGTGTGARLSLGVNGLAMHIVNGGTVLIGKSDATIDAGDGVRMDQDGGLYVSIVNGESSYYLRDITNAVYRFRVSGAGTIFATNTTISSISDERLKENIQDLDVGLDAIMALKPRKYDWKKESGNTGKNVRGFIAQEVEAIFPDLIDESDIEGEINYKSLRQDFIPILVKAIQEQQQMIEELKALIAAK